MSGDGGRSACDACDAVDALMELTLVQEHIVLFELLVVARAVLDKVRDLLDDMVWQHGNVDEDPVAVLGIRDIVTLDDTVYLLVLRRPQVRYAIPQ